MAPYDVLPSMYNPDAGVIVAANNRVVPHGAINELLVDRYRTIVSRVGICFALLFDFGDRSCPVLVRVQRLG
jgi:hypothetical protein